MRANFPRPPWYLGLCTGNRFAGGGVHVGASEKCASPGRGLPAGVINAKASSHTTVDGGAQGGRPQDGGAAPPAAEGSRATAESGCVSFSMQAGEDENKRVSTGVVMGRVHGAARGKEGGALMVLVASIGGSHSTQGVHAFRRKACAAGGRIVQKKGRCGARGRVFKHALDSIKTKNGKRFLRGDVHGFCTGSPAHSISSPRGNGHGTVMQPRRTPVACTRARGVGLGRSGMRLVGPGQWVWFAERGEWACLAPRINGAAGMNVKV